VRLLRRRLSISEVVRRVLNNHPSLLDCIKLGVVNYSSLARVIVDEVKELGNFNEVSVNAVKMGIVRFSESLKSKKLIEDTIKELISRSTVELQTDLKLITLRRETLITKLNELMHILMRARFFQLTQGTKTFTLVVSEDVCNDVLRLFDKDVIEDVINDQSAIILISPKEIISVPGVISYITSLLSWYGVNITQIISCYIDTILVLNRSDALKAYSLIEELILQLRRVRT